MTIGRERRPTWARGVFGLTCLVLGGGALSMALSQGPPGHASGPSRGHALAEAFARWSQIYANNGGDRARVMTLRPSLAFGPRTDEWGQVRLDLPGRKLTAAVVGPETGALDVWVVENTPGGTSAVEPTDRVVHVGRLEPDHGYARLDAALPADVRVDVAAVTREGGRPEDGVLLEARSSLFHHLHDRTAAPLATRTNLSAPALLLAPAIAQDVSLDALIAAGEDLFTRETFDGNGRTCATCHPPLNNFTLDPTFIRSLPPTDPLFVAEHDPNLADGFEEPQAMRQAALILENVDGTADPDGFVLRGVSHTLALPTSVDVFFLDDASVAEATGWGGDGAPNGSLPQDGALREFADGAIRQHFTRTLDRVPDEDFRFATDEELDALEAYQLSLGRQEDPDLGQLRFRNRDVTAGRLGFGARKCGACHANAGAVTPTGRFDGRPASGSTNSNTGVEDLVLNAPFPLPPDGGFGVGTVPLNPGGTVSNGVNTFDCSSFVGDAGAFGDGTFNAPPLIEAADTAPYFHNSARNTLEGAVGFYNSAAFNCSPAGRFLGGIALSATDIRQISLFLRAMNTLENIRSSDAYALDAEAATTLQDARAELRSALADVQDGIDVLRQGALHADARTRLENARTLLQRALGTTNPNNRNRFVEQARQSLAAARGLIVN